MPSESPPDPTIVLELLTAFRRSKVMFTAIALGVFDALHTGSKTATDLAKNLGVEADALERLLGACVALGLLSRTGDAFTNTPSSTAYLTKESPRRMLGYAGYSDRVLWKLWGNLPDAIREGTHRWKQTFGREAGDIFAQLYVDDSARREFLLGMHGFGTIGSPVIVDAVDLSRFATFVDLGAATGHLTVAALRRWPQLNGIVYDLPEALPLAKEIAGATEVADRIQFLGGDFFSDPLPPGDIYALARILHDWNEPKIEKLLAKIFAALPAGGAVLIVEKLLNDDKTGPEWALLQSLNMLVCTEGKERTAGEYELLLRRAGFTVITPMRTSAPVDAILAIKS